MKIRIRIVIVSLFSVIWAMSPARAMAARLSFDPATTTLAPGTTANIKINIDTAGKDTSLTDSIITFDSALLEVTDILGGSFYPENLKVIATDRVRAGGTVLDPAEKKSGTGLLATLVVRAKKAGNAQLTISCTPGKTGDTDIIESVTNTDLIDCATLVPATLTISGTSTGGTVTNTPSPSPASSAPTGTPSATPTQTIRPSFTPVPTSPVARLPKTGTIETTIFVVAAGLAMAIIGTLLVL